MSDEDPLKGSAEQMKPPDGFINQKQEANEPPKKSRRKRKNSKQQNNKAHQQNWKPRYGRQKSTNTNNNSGKKDSEKHIRRNSFHNVNPKFSRKRTQSISSISKFFLPFKRPRKEIIPPTKFLLGGNISDPLNLNSLQDEDVNRAMNALTPKSSPLPTPPRLKVEVIIPPNICDPLNLLHPVDHAEYEKQLCSPLKKRARNRKRNKRKAAKLNASQSDVKNESDINDSTTTEATVTPSKDESLNESKESTFSETKSVEKVVRDLKLDLSGCSRKRRDSECEGKSKDNSARKLRRMDSMDKIVSPVIPQPGAWMRPHRGGSGANWRGRGRCRSNNGPDRNSTDIHQEISENVENKELSEQKTGNVVNQEDEKIVTEPSTTRVFKKEDRKFQYGNYDRYYGYRNLNENMDVRLKVFLMHPHLFNGKDILDVGCNVGHMAISAAKDLHAKSVTGIDIDKKLIDRAKKNLRQYVLIQKKQSTSTITSASTSKMTTDATAKSSDDTTKPRSPVDQKGSEESDNKSNSGKSDSDTVPTERGNKREGRINTDNKKAKVEKIYFPVSFPAMYGSIDIIDNERMDQNEKGFPYNIVFQQGNYVLKDENLVGLEPAQYDLIMCLSVSKWLHLNFGDAGLKLAFKRMFAQLRPGGKLILEAQNWASYKKKKNLTETIYHHYRNIEFYPNKFHDYLLSPEVGFSQCTVLGVPQHLSKGFRRPIHLYIKGDFTPSQVQWSDTHMPSQRTPNVCDPKIKKQVYATVVTPSYVPSTQGAASGRAPYTPSIGYYSPSPYHYNPRSDTYTPSYSEGFRNIYTSNLGSLWSPNQRYTPTQSPRFTPNHMTPSHTSSTDSTKRVYAMASPRSGSDSNTGTPHHTAQSPLFGGEYSRNVNYYSGISPTQVFSPQVSEPADLVDNMDQETRSTEESSPRVNGQCSVLSSPVNNALDMEENIVIDENEVQEHDGSHQGHAASLNNSPVSRT